MHMVIPGPFVCTAEVTQVIQGKTLMKLRPFKRDFQLLSELDKVAHL